MYENLIRNPLFFGLDKGKITNYLSKIKVEEKCFAKDAVAFHSMSTEKHIMFMTEGYAKVEQYHEDGSSTFLKRLKPGDAFGILSVFSSNVHYPTHIIFEKKSEVLCISESEVMRLIKQDEQLIYNFLNFFNGQVHYLLNRIALFSMQSIEERVVQFFTQVAEEEMIVNPQMSKTELAEFLGISRASLYRVIEKLAGENRILVKGKSIKLIG